MCVWGGRGGKTPASESFVIARQVVTDSSTVCWFVCVCVGGRGGWKWCRGYKVEETIGTLFDVVFHDHHLAASYLDLGLVRRRNIWLSLQKSNTGYSKFLLQFIWTGFFFFSRLFFYLLFLFGRSLLFFCFFSWFKSVVWFCAEVEGKICLCVCWTLPWSNKYVWSWLKHGSFVCLCWYV